MIHRIVAIAAIAICSTARPDCVELVDIVGRWGGAIHVDIPTIELVPVSTRRLEPLTESDVTIRKARRRRDGTIRITIDVPACRRMVRPAERP